MHYLHMLNITSKSILPLTSLEDAGQLPSQEVPIDPPMLNSPEAGNVFLPDLSLQTTQEYMRKQVGARLIITQLKSKAISNDMSMAEVLVFEFCALFKRIKKIIPFSKKVSLSF